MFFSSFFPSDFGHSTNQGIPVGTVIAFAGPLLSQTPFRDWQAAEVLEAKQELQHMLLESDPDQERIAELNMIMVESAGWMLCDGRYVFVGECPDLFYALGNLYGDGPEEGTIYIPDYRGSFLRAVNYDVGMDPDANDRDKANGESGKSAEVGSRQYDAMQAHTHNYTTSSPSGVSDSGSGVAATTSDTPTTEPNSPARISSYETRPVNIAVNYLIKYK